MYIKGIHFKIKFMIEYISTTSKKTLFIVEYSNQYKPPITYKNIRLMLEFLKVPFKAPYIDDLPDDVICNSAIYANDTTQYSKV